MNTVETNKKLAEFLEWKDNKDGTFETPFYWEDVNANMTWDVVRHDFNTRGMLFNSDWNWLMLVWQSIPSQVKGYCISPSFDTASIDVYDETGNKAITTIFCDKPCSSLIERMYNLCVAFVDWYNARGDK